MIIGYARVSTKGQAKNGNSLQEQEVKLKENGAMVIYKDAFTGTKASRPGLDKAMATLQPGDTFMCCKLDRVARSISQGSELIKELIGKGIKVHILNLGVMDDTPASRLIVNVFFAFAEFERDMIVERTTEGKEVARQKPGFTEGRPRTFSKEERRAAVKLLKSKTYEEVSKETGISKSTLIRLRKEK